MLEREGIEEFARKAGADLFGAADVRRFDELPPEKHPLAIFPEARSVIVVGRRIPRGALRGVEEGTQFQGYKYFGSEWLEDRFLPMTTFAVAEYLEDSGWEAVPLKNLPPETPSMGVRVREGQPPPNVMLDFDDCAVRAGLGEIGYCRLLLTPGYGPRQRFQVILTDARIRPDEILEKKICPGPPVCAGFCPSGAYGGDEEDIGICGKRMKTARVDYDKCGRCRNGAAKNRHHPSGKPDRLAAVCARSCLDYLEDNRAISAVFETRFRRRDAWRVKDAGADAYGL